MNTGDTFYSTLELSDGTTFHLVHNGRKGGSLQGAHDAICRRYRPKFINGIHADMRPMQSFETCYLSAHLSDQQAIADYFKRDRGTK